MATQEIWVWARGENNIGSYEFSVSEVMPLAFAGTIEDMVFDAIKRKMNTHYGVDGSKEKHKEFIGTKELGFMADNFMGRIYEFAKDIYKTHNGRNLELEALVIDINGVSHTLTINVQLRAAVEAA